MKLKKFTARLFAFAFAVLFVFTAAPIFAKDANGQVPMTSPEPSWVNGDFGKVTWNNIADAFSYNYYVTFNGVDIPESHGNVRNNKAVSSEIDVTSFVGRYGYGQYVVYVSSVSMLPGYSDSLYASTRPMNFGYSAQIPGYGILTPGINVYYYNPYFANNYLAYLFLHNIRVTLDKNELTGYVGGSAYLSAGIVTPYKPYLTWTSSDEDVATVDQNGKVTFVGKGSAIITVTDPNAGSDYCEVTVKRDRVQKFSRIG